MVLHSSCNFKHSLKIATLASHNEESSPSLVDTVPQRHYSKFLCIDVCGSEFVVPIGLKLLRSAKRRNYVELNTPTFLERFADEQRTHKERLELSDAFVRSSGAYFFQASPWVFREVLDLHTTGELFLPAHVCFEGLKELWAPWDIRPLNASEQEEANRRRRSTVQLNGSVHSVIVSTVDSEEQWENVMCARYRKKLWEMLENPETSQVAKTYNLISAFFVLASLLILIIGSLPDLQVCNSEGRNCEARFELEVAEMICIVWFTKEFCFRWLVTPNKRGFLTEGQNIVDILSILPFYVELLLQLSGFSTENLNDIQGALLALRLLRIMRVARLFRLARHSGSMKSLGSTLKASYKEVVMLFLFMSVTIVLYSTTMYFLEKDTPASKFTSIPASFWWCVTTMTTVGYGDMVPQTLAGKVIASLTSVSGVVVLGFPIAIIVENFDKVYRAGQREEAAEKEAQAAALSTA